MQSKQCASNEPKPARDHRWEWLCNRGHPYARQGSIVYGGGHGLSRDLLNDQQTVVLVVVEDEHLRNTGQVLSSAWAATFYRLHLSCISCITGSLFETVVAATRPPRAVRSGKADAEPEDMTICRALTS